MNQMGTRKTIYRFGSIVLALVLVLSSMANASGRAPSLLQFQSYIVQGADADLLLKLVEKYQGFVSSRLDVIDGVAAKLPPASVPLLKAEPGVKAITPDAFVELADVEGGTGPISPATDYPDVVGADVVWQRGVNGSGVTVAIVDTGLAWHRGLNMTTGGEHSGRIIGWVDLVDGWNLPHDPNGHGSHVAGIVANSQTGTDNEWDGVAPGVSLVGVRVLDEFGKSSYERVIQGIQWVITHKDEYNIRVMNLSLVSEPQSPYWADPLNQAVTQAWRAGIVVVVAAGNGGPKPMTIGVPGNNPYVITVGSFTDNYTPMDWRDDYITPFSAAGPTLEGFVKPDVVAPGGHMVSIMMPSSYQAKNHPENQLTNHYFTMAGTSQSAAVVSGIASLILSHNGNIGPDEVKNRIMITSYPWVDVETTNAIYSMWQQGAGRVNAPDAVFGDISGSANYHMDINADISGAEHYEGYSYYDSKVGEFRLRGEFKKWTGGYGNWSGGYGNWSGGYGNWSGGYGNWSGGYGNWSGGYGNWSGGYGNWSGGYGNWSGGYGNWSGGYGNWSGGYGNWSGGYGNWSGSEPWIGTIYSEPSFIYNFITGISPKATSTMTSVGGWIIEP